MYTSQGSSRVIFRERRHTHTHTHQVAIESYRALRHGPNAFENEPIPTNDEETEQLEPPLHKLKNKPARHITVLAQFSLSRGTNHEQSSGYFIRTKSSTAVQANS